MFVQCKVKKLFQQQFLPIASFAMLGFLFSLFPFLSILLSRLLDVVALQGNVICIISILFTLLPSLNCCLKKENHLKPFFIRKFVSTSGNSISKIQRHSKNQFIQIFFLLMKILQSLYSFIFFLYIGKFWMWPCRNTLK